MRANTPSFRLSTLLLAGFATLANGLPAMADTTGAAAFVADGQHLVMKRPSAVGVTNTTTGEKGCHNETTQTSEPGPCPKNY